MYRLLTCVSAVLLCVSPALSLEPTPLHFVNKVDGAANLFLPVFSESGEHLFHFTSSNRICVYQTSDGELVREIKLPISTLSAPDTAGSRPWTPLSLAFGGKTLVCGPHVSVSDEEERVFWLLDTDAMVSGHQVNPIAVAYPTQPNVSLRSFVCSLGDDRLVLVDHLLPSSSRLVVFDMQKRVFDSGGNVDLDAVVSFAPNYLSMDSLLNPYVYLVKGKSEESLLALRVTPNKYPGNMFIPQSCTIEKLHVHWNENGYGSVDVIGESNLPLLPVAVSSTLSHYLCATYSQRSPSEYLATIGLEGFSEIAQRPTPVGQLYGEFKRPAAYWFGLWSSDGKFFFINDGNDSKRLRQTVISIHDSNGKRLDIIPTGEAHAAYVLAVSKDGRFVVTHRELKRKSNRGSRQKQENNQSEYQLWNLQ